MLKDQDAVRYLVQMSNEVENGRSIHWQEEFELFEVDERGLAEGANVLGNLSSKTSPFHRFAHWVLQAPFRRMGSIYPTFKEDQKLGELIAQRQDGRQFTLDILAQVLPLSLIRSLVSLSDKSEFNLVTGDGYGMMTALLLLVPSARRTIVINLTKSLILDLVYARKAAPDVAIALVQNETEMTAAIADESINLIAIQADNADLARAARIGLAVNIASMQEMLPPIIANYYDILRSNQSACTTFYCCNRNFKRLSDGTELKFDEYPWKDGDEFLVDEPCSWRNLSYNKKPPFWRRRLGERLSWHRLAKLEKKPT